MAKYPGVLTLKSLRLPVHLGVTQEERSSVQEVVVDMKFYFEEWPEGASTDVIGDTICYGEMAEKIKAFCASKGFALVEHMCHGIYEMVREGVDSKVKIWLRVEKSCPVPFDAFIDHCSFEYSDVA